MTMKFFGDRVFNVLKGKVKLDKKFRQKPALLAREKTRLQKISSKRQFALKNVGLREGFALKLIEIYSDIRT